MVTPSFRQAALIGRTSRSVEIIRKRGGKLRGWLSGADSGPASAINKGFAQSRWTLSMDIGS